MLSKDNEEKIDLFVESRNLLNKSELDNSLNESDNSLNESDNSLNESDNLLKEIYLLNQIIYGKKKNL